MKAIFSDMRALLAHPDRWTQGAFYRDKNGITCDMDEAYSYCLYGAALKCSPRNILPVLTALKEKTVSPVSWWNDSPLRRHDEVLALLDNLIREYDNELTS